MFPNTPRRLLLVVGALAVFAIAALLGLDAYREHEQHLAALQENLESKARLLSEHAELSIAAADLLLTEVESDVRRVGPKALAADEAYWQSLREALARTPQLSSLIVVDTQGRVQLSSVVFPAPTELDVSDRDYFLASRAGARRYIGEPILGRSSGRRLIPISLRLSGPDGQYQGLIMATLDIAYFEGFYKSVRDKLDLRIGMFRRDGALLALYPSPPGELPPYAKEAVAKELASRKGRTWINDSPLDGIKKVTAYRNLEHYPVAMTTAYDYRACLAALYPAFLRNTIIFVLFVAGIAISILTIARQMRAADAARDRELESAREQQETQQLCRAIARNLPNGRVAVFDREMRHLFIDGKDFAGAEKVLGKTSWELYSPEVCAAIETLTDSVFAGIEAEVEVPLEGRIYKIVAVPLRDVDGQIRRGLALTQDITKLKQAQCELEALNRQLQALSVTDGLLGIANRREFDRVLEQEWLRCAREGQPLSLLMVDVDAFKRYNDAYGHPEGDACLQQVAAALKEAAARPGDLVARYGGEEMALLLPGSDLTGAACVAERIHAILAAKNIPFPHSALAGWVTVSIGAASALPSRAACAADIVAEADASLYAAKRSGRNRTVISSQAADARLTGAHSG